MIIAIDTSQMTLSVALTNGTTVEWDDPKKSIYEALNHIDHNSIEKIIVCIGPGRYSGIRSGIAFCLGLAKARSIPIYTFSAFDIYASVIDAEDFTIAVDARKNQAYTQSYINNQSIDNIQLTSIESLPQFKNLYGNIAPANRVNINASHLLAHFLSLETKQLKPTPADEVQAIYIRPSVD